MLRSLRSLSLVLAAAGLLAPAAAHAATKKSVYPTVSSISPRKLAIGDKLTVRGSHFKPGNGRSSVAFYRSGKPLVFVRVDSATSTKLVVTVPDKLTPLLAQTNGTPVATQIRLRVVGARMGQSWTRNSSSPVIAPRGALDAGGTTPSGGGGTTAGGAPAAAAPPTCQQLAAGDPSADKDADGLTNGTELGLKLDPCNPDTDGDGLTDGYEYYAAIDLNGAAVPYPASRPWPNPLDPSDRGYDFDGDGLTLWQEFALWKASGAQFPLTSYSDGTQNTGGTQAVTTAAQAKLDLNGDGNLTDDERDFDGDGLSNMVEYNYTGIQAWWTAVYKDEKPYKIRAFSELDPLVADTDGDGIPDGADDQDNDGWDNFQEMELGRSRSGYRVQPFNPCLPDPHALTCSRWVPTDPAQVWPPFDGSQHNGDQMPFHLPNVVGAPGWDGLGGPQGP